MNTPNNPRVLRDDELTSATEEELRAHYELLADHYFREYVSAAPDRLSSYEVRQAFANFAGCRVQDVIFIESPEASAAHLFMPLTDDELKCVSSWHLEIDET